MGPVDKLAKQPKRVQRECVSAQVAQRTNQLHVRPPVLIHNPIQIIVALVGTHVRPEKLAVRVHASTHREQSNTVGCVEMPVAQAKTAAQQHVSTHKQIPLIAANVGTHVTPKRIAVREPAEHLRQG